MYKIMESLIRTLLRIKPGKLDVTKKNKKYTTFVILSFPIGTKLSLEKKKIIWNIIKKIFLGEKYYTCVKKNKHFVTNEKWLF